MNSKFNTDALLRSFDDGNPIRKSLKKSLFFPLPPNETFSKSHDLNKSFKFLTLVFSFFLFSQMSAVTITSTGTGGSWNTGGTWVGGSSPASTDDVVIASGATVTTSGNRTCASITISGTLTMSNGNNLTLSGNFTNNGTFNAGGGSSRVTFNGNNTLQTVSGSSTAFNNIIVNKGTSINNILNVSAVITMSSNGLTITNGTFKLSSASTITPFTNDPTLGSNAGFWNNGGTVTTTNGNDFTFDGLFRNSAGTTNVGNSTGDYLRYGTGSSIIIEGGIVNIAGSLRPDNSGTSTTTYSQSAGTVTCGTSGSTSGSTGIFDISETGSSFTMSNGTIVIVRANANFTGGDYLVLASTNNVTGGTIQIGNSGTPASQTIEINSTVPVYNLSMNTTNSPVARLLTSALAVKKDLTIGSGSTFNSNNLNITVSGTWVNNGTYTAGSSTALFNNASNETISGTTTFYRLVINKPLGNITLNNSITVSNLLTFTKGIIIGSATNQVLLNDNTVVSGASDSSHVKGAVAKTGNDAFVFPVGDGSFYAPISISAPSNTNQVFTAQYFNTAYTNTSSLSGLNNVSTEEYWILDRSGNTNNVNVTLSFSNSRGSRVNTSSLSDLRVARWNGSQWVSHGNGGTTYSAPNGTLISSAAVTSFSPFTLGSSSGLNPLPVQWLNFTTKTLEKTIVLDWSVYETNNKGFSVEKSLDGKTWRIIGTLKSTPNTSNSNYSFIDFSPAKGFQYYRIKQTDINENHTYSEIAAVRFEFNLAQSVQVYPNPASDNVNILMNFETEENVLVTIYNISGQKVMTVNQPSLHLLSIDISELENGVYWIEISALGISERSRLIKN